jgi:hypothetical protein
LKSQPPLIKANKSTLPSFYSRPILVGRIALIFERESFEDDGSHAATTNTRCSKPLMIVHVV